MNTRGGAFNDNIHYSGYGIVFEIRPKSRYEDVGFRIVRSSITMLKRVSGGALFNTYSRVYVEEYARVSPKFCSYFVGFRVTRRVKRVSKLQSLVPMRGGAMLTYSIANIRSNSRLKFYRTYTHFDVGFRVLRRIPPAMAPVLGKSYYSTEFAVTSYYHTRTYRTDRWAGTLGFRVARIGTKSIAGSGWMGARLAKKTSPLYGFRAVDYANRYRDWNYSECSNHRISFRIARVRTHEIIPLVPRYATAWSDGIYVRYSIRQGCTNIIRGPLKGFRVLRKSNREPYYTEVGFEIV